ncbi:MAG: RNA degradosome polyphosphate kinase [Oscillospiraceae bacterium]|nr:RNA degradosome polyphosphate kinase [Oscillospiraceae bacterium]
MSKNQKNFLYNNREISWMDFNYRVLEEAMDKNNPIMERVKFLSISSSNLDEFFMVRVAGIMENVEIKSTEKDLSGLKPKQLLHSLTEKIRDFYKKQYFCFHKMILPDLKKEDIEILKWKELNAEQIKFTEDFFNRIIFPVLTPLAIDQSRPFPFLANKTLNIAVELSSGEDESNFGIVQVPAILPRFIKLPSKKFKSYILLENIIIHELPKLFEIHEITSSCTFRITRDSDLEIDEEAEDLLMEMEKSIKKRKHGTLVRLEIGNTESESIQNFLIDILDASKKEIYVSKGPFDFAFLSKFYDEINDKKLKYKDMQPVNPPVEFLNYDHIFKSISEKDKIVYHPFESFDCVIKFVQKAAEDKNVLAIKQTLYRVSGNSPIIDALIKAAENGKQVTVLVELKARFDEEKNIVWAKKLEKAGCHVIYGVPGLKTHCKVLLVVRQERDVIKRYIHLSTGNYNDTTAKYYTDIGYFTCKESFGTDISSLFNFITGYSLHPNYKKIVVAPKNMRDFFIDMIKKEISSAKKNLKNGIIMKVNSLVDYKIIEMLYKASCEGVKIKLIVRGICCLVPGVKGISENIEVRSIVGRLLEHSRIFYFENGGDPKLYMGSADIMPRNLDRRIELAFPIEDPDLKNKYIGILNTILKDNFNARIQNSDAVYLKENIKDKKIFNSQTELFKIFKEDRIDRMEKSQLESSQKFKCS